MTQTYSVEKILNAVQMYVEKYQRPVPWQYLKVFKIKKGTLKKLCRQRVLEELYYRLPSGQHYLAFAPAGWNAGIILPKPGQLVEVK